MDRTTEKAIKRLGNHLPLIGGYLRAKGAEALIGTGEKEAVEPLLSCLRDKKERVRDKAFLAIHSLRGRARDHLCTLWAEDRDKELEGIILKAGYVASRPPLLVALTAFLNGKRPAMSISQDVLDRCIADPDPRIATRAADWLIGHKGGEAYSILWEFARARPETLIPEILRDKGYRPEDPAQRALFYFLAGGLDAYHDIDFDQSILRIWYETGEEALREAIASRIRRSGDIRLIAIFRTERGGKKRKHTTAEVDLQTELLLKGKRYEELFSLLPSATYAQGVKIITSLKERGWTHPDPRLRECQERLEGLIQGKGMKDGEAFPASYAHAIYQDFRPMLLGEETPPRDDRGLLAWAEDEDFRKRSAGVVLLAEKGSPSLAEAANRASGDPYWQVRMASAVAEVLRPGTLSPANRALLEQDHVYYVQAMLKMPSAGRLVDLTPQGIEALKPRGRISSPDHKPNDADEFFSLIRGFIPSAEKDYLLTLAEFFETGIMVSEEATYAAGETDVEIEESDLKHE